MRGFDCFVQRGFGYGDGLAEMRCKKHLGFLKKRKQTNVNTPSKINMEPTNHPFRKENDLPNLHDYGPC